MKHSLILKSVANDAADCILPSGRETYALSCSQSRSFLIAVYTVLLPCVPVIYVFVAGSFLSEEIKLCNKIFALNELLFLNFLFFKDELPMLLPHFILLK
jgi:hypothetical protein